MSAFPSRHVAPPRSGSEILASVTDLVMLIPLVNCTQPLPAATKGEAATESEAEVAKLKAMEIDRESNLSSEQTTLEKCRSAMEEAKGTADRTEEELAGQEKDCARLQEEVGGLKTKQQALT